MESIVGLLAKEQHDLTYAVKGSFCLLCRHQLQGAKGGSRETSKEAFADNQAKGDGGWRVPPVKMELRIPELYAAQRVKKKKKKNGTSGQRGASLGNAGLWAAPCASSPWCPGESQDRCAPRKASEARELSEGCLAPQRRNKEGRQRRGPPPNPGAGPGHPPVCARVCNLSASAAVGTV